MGRDLRGRHETSYFVKSVNLELTKECNLRCTYCAVSQPRYAGEVMQEATLGSALRGIREVGPLSVALNGHGETTTVPHWERVAEGLRRSGIRLHLTSNFARRFTAGEVDELARMTSIVVSIDTDDAELLRAVRRHVNLETILENVRLIRECAQKLRIRGPVVTASCVVGTHNVMHLDRFVQAALRSGFQGFGLCNLVQYPEVPGALNVSHVASLPMDQLASARAKILEARAIAISRGASFEIQSGLMESFDRALAGEALEAKLWHQRRRFAPLGASETRRCLDPWQFALIEADGSVCPCCWHPAVGSLSETPLPNVLNGGAMASLRKELMEGDLGSHCRSCPARPAVSVRDFQRYVRRWAPAGRLAASVLRIGLSAKNALDPAGRVSRRLLKRAG
jgi:MoaA/NifB/PqqE/SkfB family radical SAM enzyme